MTPTNPAQSARDGAQRVADEIRSREKKTGADGFVLTLLDVIADRDHLAELVAATPSPPARPITGGLLSAPPCPHCGRYP